MQHGDGFDRMVPYDEVMAQRIAEIPDGPRPRDVVCPLCGAAVGAGCRARTGYPARTHAPRWRAVGIARPSHDAVDRDYWDGEHRKLEAIRKQYDGMHKQLTISEPSG